MAGPEGFEPSTHGLRGLEELLSAFKRFLEVDLQLAPKTVYYHVFYVKDFLDSGFTPEASREEVRLYLAEHKDENPYTYANRVKALRRFFRDFLGRGEVVETFKLPRPPLNIPWVPTREQLREFYEAIDNQAGRIYFLLYAVSGLRRGEALSLRPSDVDEELRMLMPRKRRWGTKNVGVTFYNEEVEELLQDFKPRGFYHRRWIPIACLDFKRVWRRGREKTGLRITPKVLRVWFCCEMARLGVPDRYVDAFCGRVPRSILARHYSDFSPLNLKRIYDSAGIKVLSDD